MILAGNAVLDFNVIAQASAIRMVDCLLEGTLIAAFATLVLRVARRRGAGTRFAVWFAALIAIAMLPVLGGVMLGHGAGITAGSSAPSAEIVVPGSWALYLLAAWAGIAGVSLLRVGLGLLHLRKLRESCIAVDPESLDSRLRATMLQRGSRPAALCVSDQVAVPTALGLFRPLVVIPGWLMHELSTAELNQILLHELAHIRRWDDWTNLLQKVLRGLFFFHPAVWWIEKKISLEREMACDDAVLAQTASPRAYAECLAHLAERSFVRRSMALAQAALGRVRQTSLRIAQILDRNRPAPSRRGWSVAVVSVAGFGVACAVAVSSGPRLIAFKDATAPAIAVSPRATEASLRVIPAAFETVEPPVQKAAVAPRVNSHVPMRAASPAAWHVPGSRAGSGARTSAERSAQGGEVAGVRNAPLAGVAKSPAVHMAGLKEGSQAVTTEAVFVVVESSYPGSEPAAYHVTVWRFTVLHTIDGNTVNSSDDGSVIAPAAGKIPRKQT